MEKDKKTKKSNLFDDFFIGAASLLMIAYLGLLLFVPVIFNYHTAPLIGKVFMIMGSCVFGLAFIGIIIFNEIDIAENRAYSKKPYSVWKTRFDSAVIFLIYAYLLLRYFDENIWGSLTIVGSIAMLLVFLYVFYDSFTPLDFLLNKEKIPKLIVAVAVLLVFLFTVYSQENKELADLFVKIAVGLIYGVVIAVFVNTVLFKSKTEEASKHRILKIMVCIIIPLAVLITIPYYVKWWGLDSDEYDTFVTVYSAVAGGGLTLTGVAWTIQKSSNDKIKDLERIEKQRREDELKKAKPLFSYIIKFKSNIPKGEYVCIADTGIAATNYRCIAQLANSSNSDFIIKDLYFAGKWYAVNGNNTILRNQKVLFVFFADSLVDDWENNYCFLKIEDVLGNAYYYKFVYYVPSDDDKFNSLHSFYEVDENSIPQEG